MEVGADEADGTKADEVDVREDGDEEAEEEERHERFRVHHVDDHRITYDDDEAAGDLEAALITEHTVSNWTSALTLNKGSQHGVELHDCVIDETGALVGVISEVGLNWSRVLTLVDTDTSLGAQVFRTGELGLAQGDFSLMEKNRLRLDYLPANCQLLSGDLVVTSGLGGFYPSGLVIGSVEEVQPDDSGAASYAILKPKVDFDELAEVFIIKSFDIVT